MKKIVWCCLCVFYTSFLFSQNVSLSLTLSEAEKLFMERNLLLLAERYNVEIAEAEVVQTRLLENPVVSVEHNLYNRLSRRYFDFGSQGQTEVEIEQLIWLAGQRNKRVKLVKLTKEIALYEFEEVVRTLRGELDRKFIALYYARKSARVFDKEIESVSALVETYQKQMEKGNISVLENTRLQALLLSLRQERNEWENEILSLQGELRLLIGLKPDVTLFPEISESSLEQVKENLPSISLLLAGLWERPDLKAAYRMTRAGEANLRWQKSLAFPEFSLKGTYDRAGGIYENYFGLGVSMSLPVFNRNQGDIRAARLAVMQQNHLEQYAREEAETEFYITYARLEKALELYHHSGDIPEELFEEMLEGVNSNFRKRNISLVEFLDYYQAYKETSLQLYTIRKDLCLAMEEINRQSGSRIFHY